MAWGIGDVSAVTAVVLHGPYDIAVTAVFWSHESNPLVSQLGLGKWLLVKALLLIGLVIAYQLSRESRVTTACFVLLAVLGVVFILPNPFIALLV